MNRWKRRNALGRGPAKAEDVPNERIHREILELKEAVSRLSNQVGELAEGLPSIVAETVAARSLPPPAKEPGGGDEEEAAFGEDWTWPEKVSAVILSSGKPLPIAGVCRELRRLEPGRAALYDDFRHMVGCCLARMAREGRLLRAKPAGGRGYHYFPAGWADRGGNLLPEYLDRLAGRKP